MTSSRAFTSLEPALSARTLTALETLGFRTATSVQAASIPRLLSHQDVAVQACTGSGKTLAFLVPLVELLCRRESSCRHHEVGAIVIEPTRELALQVHAVAGAFVEGRRGMQLQLTVGGTDIQAEMRRFADEGSNVLIGTPGRLNDLMGRLALLSFKELELLVLDEADRLLDMGFESTLNTILQRLPKQRRTGLFSATQTSEVLHLVRAGLRNPVIVTVKVQNSQRVSANRVARQSTPASLTNFYMIAEESQRLPQLVHFVAAQLAAKRKLMVYFLTCASVDFYGLALPRLAKLRGMSCRPLHGKMAPRVRRKTYEWFVAQQEGSALFCTDVAARGLDIPDVDWIIQFDAPQDPTDFVHRVGRTARMGRQGQALLLLRPEEDSYVKFLELRKIPLRRRDPEVTLPSLHPELTQLLIADRDVMEKAAKAYVSYVRAYKEHQCKYIFPFDKLELGKLASSMALLRLPRLKEFDERRKKGHARNWVEFTPATEVKSLDVIKYRDKQRERQRQTNKKMQIKVAAAAASRTLETRVGNGRGTSHPGGILNVDKQGWQASHKDRPRDKEQWAKERKRTMKAWEREEQELAWESSLAKKLKKGKITEKEFYQQLGESE